MPHGCVLAKCLFGIYSPFGPGRETPVEPPGNENSSTQTVLGSGSQARGPEAPRGRWFRRDSESWLPPLCLQREQLWSPGYRSPGPVFSAGAVLFRFASHFASLSCLMALPSRAGAGKGDAIFSTCTPRDYRGSLILLPALQVPAAGMNGPEEKECDSLGAQRKGEAKKHLM